MITRIEEGTKLSQFSDDDNRKLYSYLKQLTSPSKAQLSVMNKVKAYVDELSVPNFTKPYAEKYRDQQLSVKKKNKNPAKNASLKIVSLALSRSTVSNQDF
jgi:Tfp pilus assembly protein PilP